MDKPESKRDNLVVEEKTECVGKKGKYYKIKSGGKTYNLPSGVFSPEIGKVYATIYHDSTYEGSQGKTTSHWIDKMGEAFEDIDKPETKTANPIHGDKLNEATLTDALMLLTATITASNEDIKSDKVMAIYKQLKEIFRG